MLTQMRVPAAPVTGAEISRPRGACYAVGMPTPQEILESLRQVKYPGFNRDIVSFGMVHDIQIGSRGVTVELATSSANAEAMEAIRIQVASVVHAATGLPVEFVVQPAPPQTMAGPAAPPRPKPGIPGVGAIVAVASRRNLRRGERSNSRFMTCLLLWLICVRAPGAVRI